MAGPDPRETAIKKHLGRWFTAGLTGCTFAKWAIESQRVLQLVVLDPIDDSIVDVFNAHLRVAAEDCRRPDISVEK
jgi:hypothetical protein